MRKKTLVILTLISLGLFLVGIVSLMVFSAAASTITCSSPACPMPSGPPPEPSGGLIIGFIFGYVLILAAGVFHFIAWLGTMVKQAKRQQWGWFICTILFGLICTWIYLIAEPEVLEPMVPVYKRPYQPEEPVYQPYTQGYAAQQSASLQPEVYQEGEKQYQYLEQQVQQYEDPMIMYPQE